MVIMILPRMSRTRTPAGLCLYWNVELVNFVGQCSWWWWRWWCDGSNYGTNLPIRDAANLKPRLFKLKIIFVQFCKMYFFNCKMYFSNCKMYVSINCKMYLSNFKMYFSTCIKRICPYPIMGQTRQSSLKDRQRQRCRSEASFVLDPVLQHGCKAAMGGEFTANLFSYLRKYGSKYQQNMWQATCQLQ